MGIPPENLETTTPVAATPATESGARQSVTPQQLAIVLGVLVVVLLGLVYFFFLRGGGEEEVAAPPTVEGVPDPDETAPPEDDEADDDGDDEGRVETFEVFAPRDPFEPLVTDAEGGGTTTPTEGGGTSEDDPGADTGGDGDPGDGDGDIDGDDRGQTIGSHRVKVIDVFVEGETNRAQIQVDGTVYTVDEGEQFASNFRLVSASGRCATILFGDDEFTLCEGEEILK